MKSKEHTNMTKNVSEPNNGKWWEEFPKSEPTNSATKTELEVMELKDEAKKSLDSDTAAFNLKQSKIRKSDYSWMKTLLSKGTVGDKVAAAIVLIQDNPKYNLARLDNLISMVKVSKKKQCTMIIDTVQELFLSDLLHPSIKLAKFEEQDFHRLEDKLFSENPIKKRQLLAHWYFEDQLKNIYAQFIEALNVVAHDTVDANKEKAITAMHKLLEQNAEQEEKLLPNIVNKMGDPSSKVASKAIFCLGQLLNEHPNMKQVVLNEIEKLLFRTNVSQKAQYYAICLLTQFILDHQSVEVANNLITVYFSFFKACLKKGEVDSRMMGALLMGVNRAYPFSKMDGNQLQEHVDTIYKVIHIGSFNVSLNALNLLHQIVGTDPKQSNRFYCALYKKLLDPEIATTTHQAMFLSLLFRVIKKDTDINRATVFIKRLLQVSLYFPTNMICAILYMVSQLFRIKKSLYITEFKPDPDPLIHIKEEPQENDDANDSITVVKHQENTITLPNISIAPITTVTIPDTEMVEVKQEDDSKTYDPYHRNPLYAGTINRSFTEFRVLASHFHPTVALFANTIIRGKPVVYTGDPLKDFTMIRFLDRYVFKNPKKIQEQKILTSHKNPLTKRANYIPQGVRAIPVNSSNYLNESEDKIPADELFLYRYLRNRPVNSREKNDEDDDDDDLESVNSEDFNAMLDGLQKDKRFDDLDIAGDIDASRKKRKKDTIESDDEESGNDSDKDSIDEDIDSANDSMQGSDLDDDDLAEMAEDDLEGIDDEDLSDMDFDDEDDDLSDSPPQSSGKRKKAKYDQNVFAAAEEFAELLDQEGSVKVKHGSSNAVSNTDKAAVKQLDWEEKRHRYISGYNKTIGKSRFKGGSKKRKFKK